MKTGLKFFPASYWVIASILTTLICFTLVLHFVIEPAYNINYEGLWNGSMSDRIQYWRDNSGLLNITKCFWVLLIFSILLIPVFIFLLIAEFFIQRKKPAGLYFTKPKLIAILLVIASMFTLQISNWELLESSIDHPQLYSRLAHQMVGDIHGELDVLNELISLNPDSIDLYEDRIELKRRAGRSEECKEDYLLIIELLSPVTEREYFQRAQFKEMAGDITGALDDYTKIISINPSNQEAITKTSRLKQSLGDLSGAIEILENGRNSDPSNTKYIFALSDLKFVQAQDELMRGNKLRALELYDEIISIQPNAYETLYERGILNYSLSNYMESKRDFSMVNDINRRDHGSEGLYFESFYWEAAAAIKLGKHNEAKVLIKEINEMFPDFEVPEELKKTLKIR